MVGVALSRPLLHPSAMKTSSLLPGRTRFRALSSHALLLAAVGFAWLPPTAHGAAVDVSAAENVKPARPVIPARDFKLTEFGAVGDGRTLNTAAFERAIAAVQKAGGGRLIVPPGVFRTGPFALCSGLDLHLEAGAVIQAPNTFEALGLPNPASFKTQAEADRVYRVPAPLISGKRLHDVALTGPGTIDGSGQHWWDWSERAARAVAKTQPGRVVYRRPHLVVIDGCERLLVADITLTNSSMFHLVPKNIQDLTVERVKVRAPFDGIAPNTDAIDPGPGTNFWIHHCDIDTGDDNIVIKSGGTNILIEDNIIKHGHGISIGSETTAGVHHMLVRNCTMDGTDNGIRIKSMRGAGGVVENVRYTNIRMRNVANAIILQLDYVDNNRPNFKGDPTKIPVIRNILLDHLTIEGSRNAGIIHGLPDSPITNITLRDITLTAEKDFDVKDADHPTFERVTRTIKPGVGPKKIPGEH
jgi:polygalacturonase